MKLLAYEDLRTEKGINYSKVQIWRLEKAGKFPRRVKIGGNRNGWVDAELNAYIESLIAARDAVEALKPAELEGADAR